MQVDLKLNSSIINFFVTGTNQKWVLRHVSKSKLYIALCSTRYATICYTKCFMALHELSRGKLYVKRNVASMWHLFVYVNETAISGLEISENRHLPCNTNIGMYGGENSLEISKFFLALQPEALVNTSRQVLFSSPVSASEKRFFEA